MMINYPHKKNSPVRVTSTNKHSEKAVNFGRRGMSFESQIVRANEYYLASEIAVIHKKPTPVQIVNVDYPKRSAAKISEAYFKTPSTTDFNGVYDGLYIDFEAKETTNKTTFPLANLHQHQVKHILDVAKQGGFSFLLVKFTQLDEVYLLMSDILRQFWQEYEQGIRKSIKHDEFAVFGHRVPIDTYPSVDYLKVIKEIRREVLVKDGYEDE